MRSVGWSDEPVGKDVAIVVWNSEPWGVLEDLTGRVNFLRVECRNQFEKQKDKLRLRLGLGFTLHLATNFS